MQARPVKKLSDIKSKSPGKTKGTAHIKSGSFQRLLSPEPGVNIHQPRRSVNLDPAALSSFALRKKPYLSQETYKKEYPNYPDCVSSKKPFSMVKAYSMNSYKGIERSYNEDRIVAVHNVSRPQEFKDKIWPKVSYFGVFDGHAGDSCSSFLQKNLLNYIITHKSFLVNPKEAIKAAFERAETEFFNMSIDKSSGTFKITDDSGSCACIALFVDNLCFIANVGDSRAIASYDGGKKVRQITVDHKPNNPEERKRIVSKGGKVIKDEEKVKVEEVNTGFSKVTVEEASSSSDEEVIEVYRVEPGKLAVSRSIGDLSCKHTETGGLPGVVICTPDIFQIDILSNCDFLLLGCDGIFDVLDSESAIEAAWYAEHFCKAINGDINVKCSIFVNNVLKCAMEEESVDNLSCIIIAFANFEKITKTKFLRERFNQQ